MRKLFMIGMALTVSVAMLLTSCGGSGSDDPNYPSTAVVLPFAVTDIDGNSYDAVQIGNQVWMARDLRTTRYADGTEIPMDTISSFNLTELYRFDEPYRCAPGPYQSNEDNMLSVDAYGYGYLYNWSAVMHGANSSETNPSGVQGICPNGWHVPSKAEWEQLIYYMETQPQYWASGNADHLAKALSATWSSNWGWNSPSEYEESLDLDAPGNNPSTNNATGFSALPAGSYCLCDYYDFGSRAYFWSATEVGDDFDYVDSVFDDDEAYNYFLIYNYPDVTKSFDFKKCACSVRCVRD